jgi:imidazolonepropionase
MLSYGTTTVEAKSGYGLSSEDEIRTLVIIKQLNENHPIDLVPTFLGAHEVPDEYRDNREEYIRILTEEMIPRVAEGNLAEFCDVFCEEEVFNIEESRRILSTARAYGLKLKLHADELSSFGGAELAAELGATSADHLVAISDAGIESMKEAGVIPVLLPGTTFSLGYKEYAPARKMIEAGLPVALATDCNPGSSMTENMQIILSLASTQMRMTAAEGFCAATINSAHATGRGEVAGSLEPGKLADLVIWDTDNYKEIPYHYGVNLVKTVIKRGRVVYG